MFEQILKEAFKDYLIQEGDLIPHWKNPKNWARFDINFDRKQSHSWNTIMYMLKHNKYPESQQTIFDLNVRVMFISESYESVEKAFKRFNKNRFDLAEIEEFIYNGKTYHIIWD